MDSNDILSMDLPDHPSICMRINNSRIPNLLMNILSCRLIKLSKVSCEHCMVNNTVNDTS